MEKNPDSNQESATTEGTELPTLEQLRASEERYYAKKNGERPPSPPTDKTKAYWDEVRRRDMESSQPLSLKSLMSDFGKARPRSTFHKYPFEALELQPLAEEIYTAKLATLGRKPIWDPETKQVFQNLVRYFTGDPLSPYDVQKGIYLFGPFGCGKTIIMSAFQEFTQLIEKRLNGEKLYTPRSYKPVVCRDISTDIMAAGKVDLKPYFQGIRLFDDLGNEEDKKIYGNDVSPMVDILLNRYNSFQSGGLITHATSNLAPHECLDVYGERIGSRVWEMFNHVLLDCKDKRKP